MKNQMQKIACSLFTALIFFFMFLSAGHACDRPEFKRPLSLNEITDAKFRIDWHPVNNARNYEVKYSLRVPEGRTLLQGEGMSDQPFHVISRAELSTEKFMHLVVELAAHCDDKKSASSFSQFALKNTQAECHFDKQIPTLQHDELSWVPIKSAQSYVACFFKDKNQTFCQEILSAQSKVDLKETRLISLTPICNNGRGKPVFIPVDNAVAHK